MAIPEGAEGTVREVAVAAASAARRTASTSLCAAAFAFCSCCCHSASRVRRACSSDMSCCCSADVRDLCGGTFPCPDEAGGGAPLMGKR